MSGSNIANVIFDMEESGEIDKDNCMVPKILSDSSWKKINDRLPDGKQELDFYFTSGQQDLPHILHLLNYDLSKL